ncbi:MAG: alanine--glyoxylate aminotransferase family protein [Gemmatimonadaceae bacterium]|nr:alanine--glyoxylate aminotransferase family protein [Gemmatimonadaceae bacterium]
MTASRFGTFFLPGPTEVRPEILAAMTRPMISHRSPEFEALYAHCDEGLRRVFRTSRPVFISSSSATGLMEAAIRNAPAGPILSLVNGAFSARFADIARACGRTVQALEVPYGEVVSLEAVEHALRVRRYAAVTAAHSETSTGAAQDVQAIAELAHANGAFSLIDSVSGMGGMPVETDAWALDFALTGSQKALALPPGLAFCCVSERYLAAAREAPSRGRYFDIAEFAQYAAKRQTPNTPAVSLFFALEAQMTAIGPTGMECRWACHAAMASATHAWVEHQRQAGRLAGILAPAGARSATVTVVKTPTDVDARRIVDAVAKHGLTLGTGYGSLAATTFRIGHMGDHTVETVSHLLDVLTEVLAAR